MDESVLFEAYSRMFPNETNEHNFKMRYSAKFSAYNANVRKSGNSLTFSFSPEWKNVSREITIGLVQELLGKILGKKVRTSNTELYTAFVKNLHMSAGPRQADEKLLGLFSAVNEKYFNNTIELPNLKWGHSSKRKLATYDYHSDTISVSTQFMSAPGELVSYLLYHEMLHKKLKFAGGKRTIHHSVQFRELEKQFDNHQEMERLLGTHLRKKRSFLSGLF